MGTKTKKPPQPRRRSTRVKSKPCRYGGDVDPPRTRKTKPADEKVSHCAQRNSQLAYVIPAERKYVLVNEETQMKDLRPIFSHQRKKTIVLSKILVDQNNPSKYSLLQGEQGRIDVSELPDFASIVRKRYKIPDPVRVSWSTVLKLLFQAYEELTQTPNTHGVQFPSYPNFYRPEGKRLAFQDKGTEPDWEAQHPDHKDHCKIFKHAQMGFIQFPIYHEPNDDLLRLAHSQLSKVLLENCETLQGVKIAEEYYRHWKPDKVRVILLAESHVLSDSSDQASLRKDLAEELGYDGPRKFSSLVYCLSYGAKEALDNQSGEIYEKYASKGTPQFWQLLCSVIGYQYEMLKNVELSLLLERKLDILKKLKDCGIWLIDTSIVAWYRQEEECYAITKSANKRQFSLHKQAQIRPGDEVKKAALFLSWELYIKHVVRSAASSGALQQVLKIGKAVHNIVTDQRMEEACLSKGGSHVKIWNVPAPNARLEGEGYAPFLAEIRSAMKPFLKKASMESKAS